VCGEAHTFKHPKLCILVNTQVKKGVLDEEVKTLVTDWRENKIIISPNKKNEKVFWH
jgi:hypothetical protein